jgi:hypothetical protein
MISTELRLHCPLAGDQHSGSSGAKPYKQTRSPLRTLSCHTKQHKKRLKKVTQGNRTPL